MNMLQEIEKLVLQQYKTVELNIPLSDGKKLAQVLTFASEYSLKTTTSHNDTFTTVKMILPLNFNIDQTKI